ncbi:MAG: 3-phosphoshikimate 1-carboxyvinyltransferase [Bosea sp. (in: a-proteobacteria)]
MNKQVTPLVNRNPNTFEAAVPGSKSFTNRALILAAQRIGETRIEGALHSDDTDRLAAALGSFHGLSVTQTATGYLVRRESERLGAPDQPIFINGAGTPARFLLAFAAAAEGETVVTGNARLSDRPMGDILRSFDAMGIRYACESGVDRLPIRIFGQDVRKPDALPGRWTVSGEISSQFTSALILLAAQLRPGRETLIDVAGRQVSRPYVEMTLGMLGEAGISARAAGPQSFAVIAGAPQTDILHIEPDASGMSYVLGAAAITGTSVFVPGIPAHSTQGDVGFARLLERMGCTLSMSPAGLLLSSNGRLRGIEADMDTMPDTVLTLAVVAAFAEGRTRITNVANLRVKECDRLSAAAKELGRLGVEVEEGPDWIEIRPEGRALSPARIHTYDDHRVAMAFSLAGLVSDGVEIEDPDCVGKSFPGFWEELARFSAHHFARAA